MRLFHIIQCDPYDNKKSAPWALFFIISNPLFHNFKSTPRPITRFVRVNEFLVTA